jgi:hypothetical protein
VVLARQAQEVQLPAPPASAAAAAAALAMPPPADVGDDATPLESSTASAAM